MRKFNGSTESGVLPYAEDAKPAKARRERVGPARMLVAARRLFAARSRLDHRPTLAQVRAMADLDGREPCSYLLDPHANYVPPADELLVGLEHQLGQQALSFSCRLPTGRDAELVVFPNGCGFDLLGGF